MNTSETSLTILLVMGLVLSVYMNQFIISAAFISMLFSILSYVTVKKLKTLTRIIRLNEFIQKLFKSILILIVVAFNLKIILSILGGNIWGMMIMEFGNNIFEIIIVSLGLIGLVITSINIYHYQSLKTTYNNR
jgi:flagellar biosynthesis protein FlhB